MAFAAAFGVEQECSLAKDVGERKDEPGVFGDDVGGEEIDFGEGVGDGASVDAAVGVDAVEAVQHLRGGLHLDADQAWAGLRARGIEVGGVEDDVVAFAVAEGFGDAEAVAGGGEGEGEFGDLSAAFGGEFALVRSLRAGSFGNERGLGRTQFASAGRALAF